MQKLSWTLDSIEQKIYYFYVDLWVFWIINNELIMPRTYIKMPTLGLGIPNTWGYLFMDKMEVKLEVGWVSWGHWRWMGTWVVGLHTLPWGVHSWRKCTYIVGCCCCCCYIEEIPFWKMEVVLVVNHTSTTKP
jgi:hypothetical protein